MNEFRLKGGMKTKLKFLTWRELFGCFRKLFKPKKESNQKGSSQFCNKSLSWREIETERLCALNKVTRREEMEEQNKNYYSNYYRE